ncbi:helix-turn-helix domain-containing protein [Escherichia coli]|uniref:helix-turn-helix domain-containing protein n=1 Tax=Escherichia coli TaxID=562 RepID=UPI0020200FF2|nr:helix-turn-helix domain-containing protein [Escherichia coli]
MESRIYNNELGLKINLYQSIIIYTKNCTLTIKDLRKKDHLIINEGEFVFMERNLRAHVTIKKKNDNVPYEMLSIHNDKLREIAKVFEPFGSITIDQKKESRNITDKILTLTDQGGVINGIFENLKKNDESDRSVWEFAYLLSKAASIEKLYTSLCFAVSNSFADKIRKMIEGDLSRKWRLSTIADELNVSEVTVRKRLETEDMNFNQVLLDVRMRAAVKFILDGEYHINKISTLLGISSVSYFIRMFSGYYGVTPKQFCIYNKNKK